VNDVAFEELEFAIGACAVCGRDVLTYPDVEDDAGERQRCVHCDQPVRALQAAKGRDLPEHGYGLLETQGCGNPDCGGGQCARRQHD
jgi:hypothetical protein